MEMFVCNNHIALRNGVLTSLHTYVHRIGLTDNLLPVLEYGATWRRHRKIFHTRFHPAAAKAFLHLHTKSTSILLRSLLEDPVDYVEHLK